MFIDIHAHVRKVPGPKRAGKQAYATPEQLLARYEEMGVEKACLLPAVSPECAYVPQSNEQALEIVEMYPDRFLAFCDIDPRAMTNSSDAPLGELLEHYRARGCKGVGEVSANLPFGDPFMRNLFRHVEASGMLLTFHIAPCIGGVYGVYDEPGLPQLRETLERFPDLKFLGHSQPFWAEIGRLKRPEDRRGYPDYPIEEGVIPDLMRRYPNLYGDLSAESGYNALARDEAYGIQFLNEFQDRLLFGLDICAPDTPAYLPAFLRGLRDSGKISEQVFEKVARGNAQRILEL